MRYKQHLFPAAVEKKLPTCAAHHPELWHAVPVTEVAFFQNPNLTTKSGRHRAPGRQRPRAIRFSRRADGIQEASGSWSRVAFRHRLPRSPSAGAARALGALGDAGRAVRVLLPCLGCKFRVAGRTLTGGAASYVACCSGVRFRSM